jgi:hypothetical protein
VWKEVLREFFLPGQQPERIGFDGGGPEAGLGADGTVAAQRAQAQVDVGFESHGAAVAAAGIGLFHVLGAWQGRAMPRWKGP